MCNTYCTLTATAAKALTWKVPWIELIDIDIGDDRNWARHRRCSIPQVVMDELFVGRVEAKAGRKRRGVGHGVGDNEGVMWLLLSIPVSVRRIKKIEESGRRGRTVGLKFLGEMGGGCFNSCWFCRLLEDGCEEILDMNGIVEFVYG